MSIFSKSSDQRGALMVEAIALLGLMTMISPMIVRQTAERTTEMEDVAVAGQMKTIKDALENYIQTNYSSLVHDNSGDNQQETFKKSISVGDLKPFLPASYIDESNNIRGNKLMDEFKMGVYAKCSAKQVKDDGTQCSTLGPSCKCTNYRIVGLALGGQKDGEIPDKRAARVASMLGADGGYMRTKEVAEAVGGAAASMKKVLGSQGMWEINDIGDFGISYSSDGSDAGPANGGRIAVSTVVSSGLSADYLYRKKVNGIPDANSMFTDLDMGGNGACTSTSGDGQCNRINNAGGMEVIGGRLIVRKQNNESGKDQQEDGSGDTLARIALGTNTASMQVEQGVVISAGTTPASVPGDGSIVLAGSNNITAEAEGDFAAQGATVEMQTKDGNLRFAGADGTIAMEAYDAASGATDPTSQIAMTATETNVSSPAITANATGGDMQLLANNDVMVNASNLLNMSGADVDVYATQDMILHTGWDRANRLELNTYDMLLTARNQIRAETQAFEVDATASVGIISPQINLTTGRAVLYMGSSGDQDNSGTVTSGSPSARPQSYSKLVGGLTVDSASNSKALTISDSGKPYLILQQQGLTVHASTDKAAGMIQGSQFGRNDITIAATPDRGGVIAMGSSEYDHSIEIVGKTGTVHAGIFEPNNVANSSGTLFKPVRNTLNAKFNSSGALTSGTPSAADSETFGTIVTDATGEKTYNVHGGDTSMNKFRVNPAFTSVMNDIKITSRGGARLSEALPNYILKGIYDLNNTYAKGPWPCSSSCSDSSTDSLCCKYDLPKESEKGFKYYPLNDVPTDGGNVTNNADKYIVNLYNSSYTECGCASSNADGSCSSYNACLAHPFLGVVPAPGRQVSIGDETMGGMDEGVCPDGYVAAMTITPYQFEVGKVNYVETYQPAQSADTGEYVAYMQWNWSHPRAGGVFQPATAVGVAVADVPGSDGKLAGWKVAMGTIGYGFPDVSDRASDAGTAYYMWNYGGNVLVDSMKAYAQTYCYFNPSRFTMPNMRVQDGLILSMDDVD